ncbi:hypothetical protein CEXT_739311 [Caerostris extrusa]|uniref:Uncharacterized protein n=1 Tax=Caerostris extrusa TaxID=172846 RepID=A0AAV4R564_CAEEX|nr:hypothetical protein CEXT_739311 [Caerostris extrusa]
MKRPHLIPGTTEPAALCGHLAVAIAANSLPKLPTTKLPQRHRNQPPARNFCEKEIRMDSLSRNYEFMKRYAPFQLFALNASERVSWVGPPLSEEPLNASISYLQLFGT